MGRNINLTIVFGVERIGPNYSDFHFRLKMMGQTPGGKDLHVTVEFPAWGVEHLAMRLHEVLKEQERYLKNNRDMLEKGE